MKLLFHPYTFWEYFHYFHVYYCKRKDFIVVFDVEGNMLETSPSVSAIKPKRGNNILWVDNIEIKRNVISYLSVPADGLNVSSALWKRIYCWYQNVHRYIKKTLVVSLTWLLISSVDLRHVFVTPTKIGVIYNLIPQVNK